VLAVPVHDGKLDSYRQVYGEDLEQLAWHSEHTSVLGCRQTHERCYDRVVVWLKLEDADACQHPGDDEEACARDHDQRRQVQLPSLVFFAAAGEPHVGRHFER
jgi:hypothetical protein